jgi:hypothetical protein
MEKVEQEAGRTGSARTVVLSCGNHSGCCPKVIITDTEVMITDDFGGQVKLTRAHLAAIQKLAL